MRTVELRIQRALEADLADVELAIDALRGDPDEARVLERAQRARSVGGRGVLRTSASSKRARQPRVPDRGAALGFECRPVHAHQKIALRSLSPRLTML